FRRELPYGPHLAVATVLVVFCRPAVNLVQDAIFPPREGGSGRSSVRTADARPPRPLDNPARVD
ncbi:MAG: hypothetical protein KDA22_13680, partial [Phycisphaerales bacterium]|nr:hypothetical protein [Phycisphaerales bacterium]